MANINEFMESLGYVEIEPGADIIDCREQLDNLLSQFDLEIEIVDDDDSDRYWLRIIPIKDFIEEETEVLVASEVTSEEPGKVSDK